MYKQKKGPWQEGRGLGKESEGREVLLLSGAIVAKTTYLMGNALDPHHHPQEILSLHPICWGYRINEQILKGLWVQNTMFMVYATVNILQGTCGVGGGGECF